MLFVLALFLMFSQSSNMTRVTVNYNEFKTLLDQGKVQRVIVRESDAAVT
ncbi:ATP-dependent metallopeptidase FtsH/Yme1/Tma family protein, partial [Deinococcus sp.]